MDTADDPGPDPGRGAVGGVPDGDALDEALQRLLVLATKAVDGADAVSITLKEGDGYRTSNTTSSDARAIDEAQYAGGEGPCLEAVRSSRQLQAAIGPATAHWPLFTERATALGVTAVLSTPLVNPPRTVLGALNVYSHGEDGFIDDARSTAEIIGALASVVMGSALDLRDCERLNEQLRDAVRSREVIGEAKGILMERQGCTRQEAFDMLRRASQRENRKLRDLATELVDRVEARSARTPGS